MQLENPMTFVRAMKGAPASVLWALLFGRKVMTLLELQAWTGYRADTLRAALHMLMDLGWLHARSSRGPWGLTGGRQLPLMADTDFSGLQDSSSCSSSNRKDAAYEQEQQQPTPINSASRRALEEVGVREPKLSRLARLPHVTRALVQGHMRLASEQGRGLGTAIYRIENNWPPDGTMTIAHPPHCACMDCRIAERRRESARLAAEIELTDVDEEKGA
jgi:hypothetical protein